MKTGARRTGEAAGTDQGTSTSKRQTVPFGSKVKGVVQMAAGGVLAVAGVAMCILPGPGVAAIAGGVALMSRGQRTFSGRKPRHIEKRLDAAASKMARAAKRQIKRVAQSVAQHVQERTQENIPQT